MQPFELGGDIAVCNGEIYGFRKMKKELQKKGYNFDKKYCEAIEKLSEKTLERYQKYKQQQYKVIKSFIEK